MKSDIYVYFLGFILPLTFLKRHSPASSDWIGILLPSHNPSPKLSNRCIFKYCLYAGRGKSLYPDLKRLTDLYYCCTKAASAMVSWYHRAGCTGPGALTYRVCFTVVPGNLESPCPAGSADTGAKRRALLSPRSRRPGLLVSPYDEAAGCAEVEKDARAVTLDAAAGSTGRTALVYHRCLFMEMISHILKHLRFSTDM